MTVRPTAQWPRLALALLALIPGLGISSLPAQAPSRGEATVVVAWFANRSGDPSLDVFSGALADWLADALDQARVGPVVPPQQARQLMTGPHGPVVGDELARRTGAQLMVRGEFDRRGEQIEYRADLVDVGTGRVLTTSGPFRSPLPSLPSWDALYQDLATAIDMRRVWGDASLFWPRPAQFLTWRAWHEVQANYFSRGDWAEAQAGYQRVLAADSGWVLAKYGIWTSAGNLGRRATMDSLEPILRAQMASTPGPMADVFDWLASAHAGKSEGMYQAGRRLAARDPIGEAYTVALPAVRTGRFSEVVDLYARRDTTSQWVREWRPWDGITLLALHLLGRHDDALRVSEENLVRRGLDWGTGNWQATALAASGRLVELEAVLERMRTLPPVGGNTIGGPLSAAGWELIAHGNPAKGREMFQRRLDHYLSLPASDQQRFAVAIANSYLMTGRYRDAIARYDSLSRAAPDNLAHLGQLGLAAVLGGDRARAADVEARLAAIEAPRQKPLALYWRSFIAGQRGDCKAAAALLREGMGLGLNTNDYTFHRWNAVGRARACTELPAITGPRAS